MTRKEAKAILQGLGVHNRFSLRTVNFNWDSRQVLTVKDWQPGPMARTIKEAFAATKVIVDFSGPKVICSGAGVVR